MRSGILVTIRGAGWQKLAFVVLTAVLAIGGAASCSSARPSDAAVLEALKPKNPDLFRSDGQPRFRITKRVEAQPGWYVVWIKLLDVETETNEVVLREHDPPDGHLNLVVGPGTSFPPEYVSLPPAVRKVLPHQ